MATVVQESASARKLAYPAIPTETWWRLRKQFKSKGQPRPAWNEDYLVNTGIRQGKASAGNVVRPFKRMGIFGEDGKPTDRYWDLVDDAKYSEVCQQILQDVYPVEVTGIFTSTNEEEQIRLEGWFQRTLHLAPTVAHQYATFYMLLLKADVSEQDEAVVQKPPKASRVPKAVDAQNQGSSRSRAKDAKAQAASSGTKKPRADDTPTSANVREDDHSQAAPGRVPRGFEPTLNINVQIHFPAEATTEQIDQIFKSMAKHLYQREASE